MKSIIFSLLSLCLLMMWGCEKDAFVDERKQAQSERSDEEARGNHDIHLGFVKNYNKGKVTTRSTHYEINEAISMMNEGLNSLYCQPNQKLFDSTLTFFDTIAVNVNGNDEIHEDDIAEAMDEFAEFAGDIFYDRETEDTSRVSWAFEFNESMSQVAVLLK